MLPAQQPLAAFAALLRAPRNTAVRDPAALVSRMRLLLLQRLPELLVRQNRRIVPPLAQLCTALRAHAAPVRAVPVFSRLLLALYCAPAARRLLMLAHNTRMSGNLGHAGSSPQTVVNRTRLYLSCSPVIVAALQHAIGAAQAAVSEFRKEREDTMRDLQTTVQSTHGETQHLHVTTS